MHRTLFAVLMFATGSSAAYAGALEDATAARNLAVSSLAHLQAVVAAGGDPRAVAEQLRTEVHVPLLKLYSMGDVSYDRSELLPFQTCFAAGFAVDGYSNEVEYALKMEISVPEMLNRAEYTAALDTCAAALKAATKP